MWQVNVAPCTGCGRIHAARTEAKDGLDDDDRATLRVRLEANLDQLRDADGHIPAGLHPG